MNERRRGEDARHHDERDDWIDLGALLDGECNDDTEIELRDRLAADRELRARAERLRTAENVLREHDPAGAVACDSEALLRSVRQRLGADGSGVSRPGPTRVRGFGRRWARTGAAAAVLAVAWFAWRTTGRDAFENPPDRNSSAPIAAVGESGTAGDSESTVPSGAIDREIAHTDRERQAGPAGSANREPSIEVPEPSRSFAGARTLAVIEDDWPLRCRERAREILASVLAEGASTAPSVRGDRDAEPGPGAGAGTRPEWLVELDRLGRDAIPVVLDLLDDEDANRRRLAFDVLLELDEAPSLPALAQAAIREGRVDDAFATIEDRSGRDAVAALEILARESAETERASLAIARIGNRVAIDALLRLHATAPHVRSAATVALGEIESELAAAALLDLYDEGDPSPVLRVALRRHAATIGPKIVRRLGSPDASRASAAVELLGDLRYRSAVEPLIARVRANPSETSALVAALRCGGARAVPDVLPWIGGVISDSAPSLRRLAACLDDEGVRSAVEVARSKKGEAGRNAVRLLAAAGDRAVEPLASVLRDARHVQSVIEALVSIGSDAAVAALAEALPRDVERVGVIRNLLETGRDDVAVAWLRRVADREGVPVAARLVERIERDRTLRGRLSLD